MLITLKSPPCVLWWTSHLFQADRKYPHRSGVGYYSVTGNFTQENKKLLNELILRELGRKVDGTIAYKSDGVGNTDVKFKCLEELKTKEGKTIHQAPSVLDKEGNPYAGEIETATGHIYFQPRYYASYQKTSLILNKVEVIGPPPAQTEDEKIEELMAEMNSDVQRH